MMRKKLGLILLILLVALAASAATYNSLVLKNQGVLKFKETRTNGANFIGLQAASSLSGDQTFILPTADGSANEFIKTDGSGNLAFSNSLTSPTINTSSNHANQGELRLAEQTGNGSNYVGFSAPDAVTTNTILKLPDGAGTNGQTLVTDGTDTLTWQTPVSDTVQASGNVDHKYKDDDTTDGDVNGTTRVNCTDTGSGTEDCDYSILAQVAGTLTSWLDFDADGGSGGSPEAQWNLKMRFPNADSTVTNPHIAFGTGNKGIGLDSGNSVVVYNGAELWDMNANRNKSLVKVTGPISGSTTVSFGDSTSGWTGLGFSSSGNEGHIISQNTEIADFTSTTFDFKVTPTVNGAALGGGGGSGKLYIDDGFEAQSSNSYTQYDDGASATPVDATGGTSSNVTMSFETTNYIFDGASLKAAKGAADAQGEGFCLPGATMDEGGKRAHKASLYYYVDGTYSTGDWTVYYVERDTDTPRALNARLITGSFTNNVQNFTPQKGNNFVANFTTDAQYDICFHYTNTDTTASNLYIDLVRSGLATKESQTIVTAWESWTPTGAWSTNTTYTGFMRRVGDTLELQVEVETSGAPTSADLRVDMPSGLTIDESKFLNTGSSQYLGRGAMLQNGVAVYPVEVVYGANTSTSSFRVQYLDDNTDALRNQGDITQAAPFTFGSGDRVIFEAKVPIDGWDTGSTMSASETSGQTLKLRASMDADQTISTTSITAVTDLDVIDHSTHGTSSSLYNTSTSTFTSPEPSYYEVYFQGRAEAMTSGTTIIFYIYKNGSEVARSEGDSTSTAIYSVKDTVYLEEGDTIQIQVSSPDGSYRVGGASDGTLSYLLIEAKPDYSNTGTLGIVENIKTEQSSTSTSTSAANTWTDITGVTLSIDAGVWITGYTGYVAMSDASGSVNDVSCDVRMVDSGGTLAGQSQVAMRYTNLEANDTIGFPVSVTTVIDVLATDTYKLQIRSSDAAANATCDWRHTGDVNGGTTNPDTSSVIFARRIQ